MHKRYLSYVGEVRLARERVIFEVVKNLAEPCFVRGPLGSELSVTIGEPFPTSIDTR